MIAELGRYRHQVFIEKLGWDVVSTSRVRDQEFDQFDHPQTRYIVAMGRQVSAVVPACADDRRLPAQGSLRLPVQRNPAQRSVGMGASRYAAGAADDPQLAMKILVQPAMRLVPGRQSVVAVTTTAMERYFVRNG
ncbi:autoinducer synthesis protein RhlI [Pseudomonas aeruginosa]|nr:autoinducer synthesis protein RhlI [Pseudomonas aeruginosa]